MKKNEIILKGLIYQGALEFLWKEGFVGVPYPGITNVTGSCEAVSNVFSLNEPTFQTLSQTVQLFLEHDIINNGLPRMFSTNRSFRKDNKNWKSDGRHLNDFELLETEALDTDLPWLLNHAELLLNSIFIKVLNASSRYGLLTPKQHHQLYMYYEKGFKIITYTEAVQILQEAKEYDITWGDDLKDGHEQWLINYFDQNLMITHYPESIKFFNMLFTRDTIDTKHEVVDCVDVILKHSGESIGGSVREYDYNMIKKRLQEGTMVGQLKELKAAHDGKPEEVEQMFDEYLELFVDNPIRRSGLGLGFGRVLQFILGSDEIVPF
jgi:asparaginyl-tRNA synthetase